MKRKCVIVLLLIFCLLTNIVYADDIIEEINSDDVIQVTSIITDEPNILSRHAIVMERTTGTILYEKDAYTKTAMASTTKILTAIVALENSNLQDEVIISKKAAGTGGSTLGITANSSMTMECLLYGLLLRSGNDCAVAIAEHIGTDVEGFAVLMNKKADEIGLTNSHFVTPHGLDSDEHYTTAYDMAILTEYALQNETFSKFVNTKQIDIMIGNYSRHLNNTHELLGNVSGVYGVKTGFTGNAGRCLVTAIKRDNLDVIIVVLGADTKKIRTEDTQKLINYIYNNYEMIDTYNLVHENFDAKSLCDNVKVVKSVDDFEIELEEKDNYVFPINKNEINKIRTSTYCLSLIKAPINSGTKVGEVRILIDKKILYTIDLKLSGDIKKKKWKDYMKQFIFDIKSYF